MTQIHKGMHLTHYGQVTLFNPTSPDAIPQWETGEEAVIFGSDGISVATKNDEEIEIFIFNNANDIPDSYHEIGNGRISVGDSGLQVGEITTNSISDIAYSAGSVNVGVYVNNSTSADVDSVAFLLT